MRVVDVSGFYCPQGGGIRTYTQQKLQLADQLGYDITILAPGASNGIEELTKHARIRTIASPHFPLDRKYFAFADRAAVHAALQELSPDWIEASSPWRSAEYVADFPGDTPRSLIMHSEPLSAHVYRWFETFAEPKTIDLMFDRFWERLRSFGRSFDTVICANTDLTARLAGGGVANVATVPMGVEQGVFSPAKRSEALRRKVLSQCALGPEATLLVCAGRLATEKRIPMLIEAATIAGAKRPLALAIFGSGRAHGKVLRAIAGNPHIRLFQPVDDREKFAAILASADGLLHGCEAETFGMIAAEAHASGLPIIAPMGGGAADFAKVRPELSFKPADAGDAARAILCLGQAASSQPTMTGSSRSIEDHFRDLLNVYSTLLGCRSARAA